MIGLLVASIIIGFFGLILIFPAKVDKGLAKKQGKTVEEFRLSNKGSGKVLLVISGVFFMIFLVMMVGSYVSEQPTGRIRGIPGGKQIEREQPGALVIYDYGIWKPMFSDVYCGYESKVARVKVKVKFYKDYEHFWIEGHWWDDRLYRFEKDNAKKGDTWESKKTRCSPGAYTYTPMDVENVPPGVKVKQDRNLV